MEKFTVAGVSTLNGTVKVRFANDIAIRVKVLARNGHDAIRLIELPTEMDKITAARFLSANEQFADIEAQAAITKFLGKREAKPAAPKAAKTKKVTVAEMA